MIAWVLVAMEVRVERAQLRTVDQHGQRVASDTFYLRRVTGGCKLTDAQAHDVCGRLSDHLDVCAPKALQRDSSLRAEALGIVAQVVGSDTVITLEPSLDTPHLLLDVSSCLSAMDLSVTEAVKQDGSWTFRLAGETLPSRTLKSLVLLLANQVCKPAARATQLLEVPD